jgi:hypothetical protein
MIGAMASETRDATSGAPPAPQERRGARHGAPPRRAERGARDRPPPRGWDVPRRDRRADAELEALAALVASLRDLLPPERCGQLAALARRLALVARAVLDGWLDEARSAARDAPGRDAGAGTIGARMATDLDRMSTTPADRLRTLPAGPAPGEG